MDRVVDLKKGDEKTRGDMGREVKKKGERVVEMRKREEEGKIREVKGMEIGEGEFEGLGLGMNEKGLGEMVDDYVLEEGKEERKFWVREVSEEEEGEGLEKGLGKEVVEGYWNVIGGLKEGYGSMG